MNGVPTGFGARVRTTRSQLGLSQRELGREAGVHFATIGKIETGTRDKSPGAELVAGSPRRCAATSRLPPSSRPSIGPGFTWRWCRRPRPT